ncbi:uncharacterized protein LOC112562955 [Pomacea canaliculata]|uniref:uncharacterized protein LOC112562955 n=1 Tax=Pomacea canaliculata TaxID=400727 RepID=UPI000D73FF4C|nr:uncharacterized protein LOC112562955 [Pomacea canaliculata]
MLAFLVFSGWLCCAFAQLHGVCYTNAQLLREEEVVALVSDIVDRNEDNIITTAEVVVGFADILGYQFQTSEALILLMNRDQLLVLAAELGIIITRENFVQKWQERFGDSVAFIRATFDAYDENKDGQLSVLELEYILKHVVETVDNGDGIISAREFREYLLFVYKNC